MAEERVTIAHWQNVLEDRAGVPTDQAAAAAAVLQRQHENPDYQPSEEELAACTSAWQWMAAKVRSGQVKL